MNLAILGKIGAGILFAGSSTFITVAIVDSELLGIYSNVHVYGISSKVNVNKESNFTDTNYKCRFRDTSNADKGAFECSIHKLKNQDKKQFVVEETIKKLNDNAEKANYSDTITNDNLAKENNAFQVTFSSRYWNKGKETSSYKIEIIKNDETVQFASLTQLFAIYQNKTNAKNTYFVVKSSSTNDISVETGNKCSFAESVENNKKIVCKIFQFDTKESAKNDQQHTALTFAKATSESSNIEEHKHYLIQFTEDTSTLKNTNNEIVYWQKDDLSSKKIKFTNVKQAFLDSNNKYDHIFIF